MDVPPSPRYRERNLGSPSQSSPRQIPKSAFFRSKSPAVNPAPPSISSSDGGVRGQEVDEAGGPPEEWYARARESNNRSNRSDHGDNNSNQVYGNGSPLKGLGPSRSTKRQPELPSPLLSTSQATHGHSPAMPLASPDIMSASGTRRDRNGSSIYTGSENEDDHGSSAYSPQIPPVSRARSGRSSKGHKRQSTLIARIPPPKMYHDETSASSASLSQATHGTSDSDTMLMALLASQAAVDCQTFAVGGWEEVDAWKKELTMLTSRLASVVARHQREQKILTAAKTLAKLNNSNKRMSKQSMESLDVTEKKAADAEKEMLLLRDREQDLRRRLLEHWAGVMAWEVKRLGLIAQQAEEKLAEAAKNAEALEQLDELAHQVDAQDIELGRKSNRIEELEGMMQAMSAREMEMEKEMREMDKQKRRWDEERQAVDRRLAESQEGSKIWDTARSGLKQALRRDDVDGLPQILEAVSKLESAGRRKDEELKVIKDEMREVGMGLEAELGRVAVDRDALKARCEELAKSSEQELEVKTRQVFEYEAKMLRQADKLSSLQDSYNKLQDALSSAEKSSASSSRDLVSSSDLQKEIRALRTDLEANDVLLEDLWTVLPSSEARRQTGLIDASTDRLHDKVASPSTDLNFEGLRAMYVPQSGASREPFGGGAEAVRRVKALLEDSRVLVERVANSGQERELLKNNASRAQKLVEDSRRGLETYQHQVTMLEARLKNAGSEEGAMLEQLNDLRANMDKLSDAKRRLEADAVKQAEICERLSQANDSLSAKALTMAEDAEQEKRGIQLKLEKEIDVLKIRLRNSEEDLDDMRTAEQSQRIQLLDELNSLQGEVTKLRSQIRLLQRGETPPR